jgi:ADP-heptose:LPS heptosyltransferase
MKTALVIRCGAYGDNLIISPIFKALRNEGYEKIICHTGKRGMEVLGGNPNIDEFIPYEKEGIDNPQASEEWEALEKRINGQYSKNFAESLEVNISLHPRSAVYSYPKYERYERGNRNFYEVTEQIAEVKFENYYPDIYLTDEEIEKAESLRKKGLINILWGLSGSGQNKAYPWTEYAMGELIKNYSNIHIISVGDEKCQIIEPWVEKTDKFTNLSGRITFRESIALTKVVDLVVAPDTGLLHASGAFDTPKIGILGHTTIENVTKHFRNDFSLEADQNLCECSPCFRLIYDHKLQCPIDVNTHASWCMSHGQPVQRLYERITECLGISRV